MAATSPARPGPGAAAGRAGRLTGGQAKRTRARACLLWGARRLHGTLLSSGLEGTSRPLKPRQTAASRHARLFFCVCCLLSESLLRPKAEATVFHAAAEHGMAREVLAGHNMLGCWALQSLVSRGGGGAELPLVVLRQGDARGGQQAMHQVVRQHQIRGGPQHSDLHMYVYIYIYIYIHVQTYSCACVCVCMHA